MSAASKYIDNSKPQPLTSSEPRRLHSVPDEQHYDGTDDRSDDASGRIGSWLIPANQVADERCNKCIARLDVESWPVTVQVVRANSARFQ